MRNISFILIGLLLLGFFSCDDSWKLSDFNTTDTPEEAPTKKPLARVGERFLYWEDIADMVPSRASTTDSANIINRYIDSWVKKQLMLNYALKNIDVNESEIERKIQDYRYQLIVYEYQKELVNERLESDITQAEIEEYYQNYSNSFELKQNIVKCMYLKIPKEVPRAEKVEKWLRSDRKSLEEKLRAFAYSYAEVAMMNDSVWLDFNELISNTPFMDQLPNKVEALKSGQLLEASDSTNLYYIRVNDYKLSEQLSPLEFVQDQIRDILLNKRRIELIQQHENAIYKSAKENEEYEVFN